LRPKLLASYVTLGVCITLLSLLGGGYNQRRANRAIDAKADLLGRTVDVASLCSSASEEGFSYLIAGEPQEKASTFAKLDSAAAKAIDLRTSYGRGDEEVGTRLTQVIAAVGQLRTAATLMFAGYERSGVAERKSYEAYDEALDELAAQVNALHAFIRAQNVQEAARVRRVSDGLTVLIGLFAVCIAVGVGVAFSGRVTKSVLALRDVVTAFGRGQLDVVVPPGSGDEVGELGSAFQAMMTTIRRNVETMERGRLEDVFASIDEILVVCDAAGIVLATNPACCRVSGRTEAELVGKPLAFLVPDADRGGSKGDGAAGLTAGRYLDATLKAADGRLVPLSLSLSKLRGQGGDGWVCAAQDLTQRHRLEAELRQAQKLEAIGRLAGGVAHDFNNMLSVVLGYTVILLDGMSPDDPKYESLLEVKNAGERSADLTRQLLAFSRQERLETRIVNLSESVAETLRMARRVLGEDIEIRCSAGDEECLTAVEPGQIEQIVMNLALNARDAMPGGGKLDVRTSLLVVGASGDGPVPDLAPGRYATLAVTDTGTGMDAATLERIFEPFFTTKEQGKGTGLGLATVFGIVSRCQGQIRVQSEVGGGTTFTLCLPEAERGTPQPEAGPPSARSGLADQTILLVEDEESVRTMVCRILRRTGYRVLTAKDPTEAATICDADAGPIDLLLTDVIMPGMNGHQLASQLLVVRPDMKVLYMSGYTADVALNDHPGETRSFLQKPIRPGVLTSRVRDALRAELPALAG
jgi:PAS domain S-box-containing protein